MLLGCVIAAVVACLGLACVRTAAPLARWLAFVLVLGFVVVVAAADGSRPRAVEPVTAAAPVGGDEVASRTQLFAAAARVGPRADELAMRWRGPLATAADDVARALGARASAPPPLPFAPGDVRCRVPSELAVDRPATLEVAVVGLGRPLPAELVVVAGGREVLREAIELGPRVASVALLPAVVGRHVATVRVVVGEHEVVCEGAFEVGPPDEVLVVGPADSAVAALRVQGVRCRAAAALPDDWRRHRTVVLDEVLPQDQQQDLVAAVLDGVGVFVTARAFGAAGAPLRAILPVRVLPQAGDGGGSGAAGGGDAAPAEPPPPPGPEAPPADPPRADEPIGSTDRSGPIAPEPIDVDKHAIAMVLVVDRSYSMGARLPNGQTKMSYAKTSALRTARALGEGDRVGVVTFGDKGFGRVELPMREATDEPVVRAGIEKLSHARESTFLLSGLRLARDLLERERAAVKHVVVVTDGEYRMDEQVALRAEANRMRAEGKATLSMISITDEATDPQFLQLAELLTRDGGGRFLPIQDPSVVPVLVSAEVTRALSRVGRAPRRDGGDAPPDAPPPEQQQPEQQPPDDVEPPQDEPPPPERRAPPRSRVVVHAVAESPLLAPGPEEWPTLAAALATDAPLEARVLLVAGDDGWPLLAFANRGLGRVGAFAADLTGDACAELREHASFPAWLAQWVAATAPSTAAGEARQLLAGGVVAPPAPVPGDVRWLQRVSGADVVHVDELGEVAATVGREAAPRASDWSPWLLAGLLVLAFAERALLWFGLRRGRA